MKVCVTTKEQRLLFSITDVAKAIGWMPNALWYRIKTTKQIEGPSVQLGNRLYYDQATFDKIVAALHESEAMLNG